MPKFSINFDPNCSKIIKILVQKIQFFNISPKFNSNETESIEPSVKKQKISTNFDPNCSKMMTIGPKYQIFQHSAEIPFK